MKWGVRKEDRTPQQQKRHEQFKKAAVILGSAAAVAAMAAGAYYVSSHMDKNVSEMPSDHTTDRGEAFAQAFAKEPVGIVHAARGRSRGFTFPGHGGLDDPFTEYKRAFDLDNQTEHSFVRRYGDRQEKVAARFADPENRKDQAGRPITHDVMLPEDLAYGVETEADVIKVAWPLIKDTYAVLYDG